MLTTTKVWEISDEDLSSIFTALRLYAPKTFAILDDIPTMAQLLSPWAFKYVRYGDRYVLPVIEYMQENGGWNKLGTNIGITCDEKWSRLLTILYADYNPLFDYSRVETFEGSEEGVNAELTSNKTTSTLEQTSGQKFYGFNSNNSVPVTENDTNSETITQGLKADNQTDRTNNVDKEHTLNVEGRSASPAKLLDEEYRFRMTQIIEVIYQDIASFICCLIY